MIRRPKEMYRLTMHKSQKQKQIKQTNIQYVLVFKSEITILEDILTQMEESIQSRS